jgi:hypothetical protein
MTLDPDQAHDGPPDAPGWWLIKVPTNQPYLLQVIAGETPDIIRLWQAGFRCWRLTDVTEMPRIDEVMSGLMSRPKLFWAVGQAFSMHRMAGPWVLLPKMIDYYVRRHPDGTVAAKVHYDEGFWATSLGKTFGDQAAAVEAVDLYLKRSGYVLFD